MEDLSDVTKATMFHDLRMFYDGRYRLHQVKLEMRQMVKEQNLNLGMLFAHFDTDGSGEIDRVELKALVARTGVRMKEMELETLMQLVDEDGSGAVGISEFTNWYNSTHDDYLSNRRRAEIDLYNDKRILMRQSIRYDPEVRE